MAYTSIEITLGELRVLTDLNNCMLASICFSKRSVLIIYKKFESKFIVINCKIVKYYFVSICLKIHWGKLWCITCLIDSLSIWCLLVQSLINLGESNEVIIFHTSVSMPKSSTGVPNWHGESETFPDGMGCWRWIPVTATRAQWNMNHMLSEMGQHTSI